MSAKLALQPLFLVSCVSKKHSTPRPARELYCSDWFRKARAYVEMEDAKWFILSAKHGLVSPDQVIKPYNMTLKNMSTLKRRGWAKKVADTLQPHCKAGNRVIVLGGSKYREHLVPLLKEWGCYVETPLEGMGIGQQKRWLKHKLTSPATEG